MINSNIFRKSFVYAFILICIAFTAIASPLKSLAITTSEKTHTFEIEIMGTPEERAKGLMFRKYLADNRGMLFDFGAVRPIRMWMKNTYIPLDMIFIRTDGTIAGIAKNTVPMSEAIIAAPEPVRYVLEVNAGISDRFGIRKGDRVALPIDDN